MITLEDLQVKDRNALQTCSPEWSKEEIRRGLLDATYDMVTFSYYGPYVDRFPIIEDGEIDQATLDGLDKNNSCACTDGTRVCFSSERAVEFFKEAMRKHGETYEISKEVRALISHEYTHILCEHQAIAEALARKYDNGGKVPAAVAECHTVACEIQANRGAGVEHNTVTWKIGVTDERFPETKGLYTYSEIFAALLQSYNKKQKLIKQLAQTVKDMIGDELVKQAQDKKGQGKGKGEGKKEKAQGQGQGQSLEIEDGNKAPKTEEATERELTPQEIEDILKKAESAEQEVYGELQEFGGGYGLDAKSDNKLELNPDNKLSTEFKRWDEQRIKKELKRMKGYVRGSLSRERQSSYSRPSRRNIDPTSKLIRKGVKKGNSLMPKVLVAMDSSGSMGGTPVTAVATAIGNLFKDLGRPTEGCYIVKHHHECSKPQPLSQWKEVVESFYPSGGNCFNNVIKLANELNVDVVFNIGDGCDCCVRSYEDHLDKECSEFMAAGRKWVDTLILDKKSNGYFDSEYHYDQDMGFEREILQLGSQIGKYL